MILTSLPESVVGACLTNAVIAVISRSSRAGVTNAGCSGFPLRGTVARFVDEDASKIAVSTTKRRVCAIQFAHRMSDVRSPIGHSEVYLAVRRARRAKRARPKQALRLTAELLREIVAACPQTIAGLRDAAMFSVGYDTLCRSSELAAMRVEHLSDDLGSLFVPRSKSDPFGDGRIAYSSPATQKRLQAWLDAAVIGSGALFRGLHTNRVSDVPLDTCSIRRRVKVAATRAISKETSIAGSLATQCEWERRRT